MCIRDRDVYGSFECIVFPKVLNEFSPRLQEDNLVAIAGRLSIREDEAPKILMQSVQLLDEALMAKKEPKRLYIQLETRNDENLKNVETVSYTHLPPERFSAEPSITPFDVSMSAPSVSNAFICWSIGRVPKSHPPGGSTIKLEKRPKSAPIR